MAFLLSFLALGGILHKAITECGEATFEIGGKTDVGSKTDGKLCCVMV